MKAYEVESVSIAKIAVGARRRESVGSVADLKASLDRVGQIHPITVRREGNEFELVAGERRLRSAESLGWKKIWARIGDFTDEELRDFELEENVGRLDLTPAEASKARLRALEKAAADVAKAMETCDNDVTGKRGPKPGPSQVLSGGDAKKRSALRQEISRNRRHVEAAEIHPEFAEQNWKQSHVLAATDALKAIPKREQKAAVELVTARGVDPQSAVKMLENLAEKPPENRKEIFDMYQSGDARKRSLALTRASKLPPLPPPILADLDEAVRRLRKAASREGPRASKYAALASDVAGLLEAEEKDYERLKTAEEAK